MRRGLALGALLGVVFATTADAQPASYWPPIDWLKVAILVDADARLRVSETVGLKTWERGCVRVNVPPTYQPPGTDFLLRRDAIQAFDDRGAPLTLVVFQGPAEVPERPRDTVFDFFVDLVWELGSIRLPVPPSKTEWLIEHPEWALPLLALALCLVLWARSMRNAGRSLSIKPEYEPPRGLRPGEMGTLIDGTVDPRDVVATLVDLAGRGYVRIERVLDSPFLGSDYSVTLLKSWRDAGGLKPFERILLSGVFIPSRRRFTEFGPFRIENEYGGDYIVWSRFRLAGSAVVGSRFRLASTPLDVREGDPIKEPRFFSEIIRDGEARDVVRLQLYRDLIDQRFLAASPHQVRWPWRAVGLATFAGFWIAIGLGVVGASTWLAGSVAGVILMVFAPARPRMRYRGTVARAQILGFREMLQRAEKDQLARLPADTLHKWLPYAIALGVESGWMAGFESLSWGIPPEWYHAPTPFDGRGFAEEVEALSRKVQPAASRRWSS